MSHTLCCSLTCRLPRAHHLPQSLFLLPLHKNIQHDRNNTIISKNNQGIMIFSRLSQSTSSIIKNHSAVKTCRVTETRARQLPQILDVMKFSYLSISKIPSDDVLESLYKLRIRESEQLKTVLELYDMEIHQKISVPNYQKLKTMVKRRRGQKLR